MTNKPNSLLSELVEQDRLTQGGEYKTYRARLARSIESAKRRERIAFRVCAVAGVISSSLMFVGGTRIVGSFDPWSAEATVISMFLGAGFLTSTIVFWVLLASYYSRFRPRTRQAHEDLRDLQLLRLESQVETLQLQVSLLTREQGPGKQSSETKERPHS